MTLRRIVRVGWSGIAAVALLAACNGADEIPAVAHVRALEGTVTVKISEATEPEDAAVDRALSEGHIISTGDESTTTVEFQGGNKVELTANSSLVIRKTGSTTAQFGAVILEGNAKYTSGGQGVLLAIGTPFGLTEVGIGEVILEISSEEGFKVLVGEISVLTEDGRTVKLGVGDISIQEVPDAPDEITIAPVVLLANPKQVQVRRKGETNWRTPKKRDALNPGDAIRTRKGNGTRLQFEEHGHAVLTRGSELVVGEAGTGGKTHRANYTLAIGNVVVHLDREQKLSSEHTVEVAGLTLKVAPGAREASVEVSSSGKGAAKITVRFGRVELSDGTILEAGSTVNVRDGAIEGAVRPLANTQLDLRPRSSSIVYFTGSVPPIEFGWAKDGAEKYEFQVAKDRGFKKLVFHEKVSRNGFVYDKFKADKYHWRVKGKGDWVKGILRIQKGRAMECADCKRNNVVDDNGERTVVRYQTELPAITLRWKAMDGASRYAVRVYLDGELDSAHIDKKVEATTAKFKEGDLAEGKYFWQVIGFDAAGKNIAMGHMNTLAIEYDNAIIDLAIKSPRNGQRISSRAVVTRGEVQLGARLSINERKASVDRKGRFRESVKLNRGVNQIVYRTISTDGVERFYVRDVYRK